MKFKDLYKAVFIAEQDENVAQPENFDDVEPAPVVPSTEETEQEAPAPAPVAGGPENLASYVDKLESFADELISLNGNSLQDLVTKLDIPGSAFEGLVAKTDSEIIRAAETLRAISEQFKSFIINSAKVAR